ncbi:hypothetical protein SLE2022_301170 [Rubroshorea leprosula]
MFRVSLSFFCSYYFPVILLAEEDILIHNQAAQEELCRYGSYINLQEDKPQASLERPETISPALTSGEHLSIWSWKLFLQDQLQEGTCPKSSTQSIIQNVWVPWTSLFLQAQL